MFHDPGIGVQGGDQLPVCVVPPSQEQSQSLQFHAVSLPGWMDRHRLTYRLSVRFDGDSLCPPIRDALGVVVTERLFLRPLQEGDTDRLAPIFAKEEVWRYPFGRRLTRHETVAFVDGQLAHWVRYGFGLWLVEERLSGRAIGYLGLSVPTFLPAVLPAVEVGWRLDPSAWGRGYATEGGAAALAQAFGTLGLERVVSLTQTDNAASCRVAERIGMTVDHAVIAPATEKRGPVQVAVYEIAAGQLRT